jgi:glycosyltransferase involved in cell wall biosynthesis
LIAVVIPVHNEQAHLFACLRSVHAAAASRHLEGERVIVVVVLDDCSDASLAIATQWSAHVVEVKARNVGQARALGAEQALALGATWLAFTDADTEVSVNWLAAQRALVADAVCGTVGVRDWGVYGDRVRDHHHTHYQDADGHRHVHGANLGVAADAYRMAGGFRPLTTGEDVALVADLERSGARIVWSAAPRVHTSARESYRAPLGFGATLERVHRELTLAAGEGLA